MPDEGARPASARSSPSASFTVRPFGGPGDREAIERICVLTGDAGGDARAAGLDTDALVARYATPYLNLEPGLALVAEASGAVVGYALGALDTPDFARRVRDRIPEAAWTEELLVAEAERYPSHLHVDLLPEAQGRGLGRRLVQTLLNRLLAAGSPGVHLGVDPRNTGALAFYPRLGFTESRRDADVVVFVKDMR